MGDVCFNHSANQAQMSDQGKGEIARILHPQSLNEESQSSTLERVVAESLINEDPGRGLMEHGCPHYRRRSISVFLKNSEVHFKEVKRERAEREALGALPLYQRTIP